jgi:hypothetical protein
VECFLYLLCLLFGDYLLLFDTNLETVYPMDLIDYDRTLFLITVITTGSLAYLIRFLYEGYDSRAHIRALKSRGIPYNNPMDLV